MILSANGLGFSYPARHVFTGWSHTFTAGLTWVRGPNGSGKSTLLQLLAGALPLRSGTLSINGIDAAQQPLAYRREVFWCGSGPIAFDHLRPPEFFGFMSGLYPSFDADALATHIAGFGLAPHLDMRLANLSAGTQRKVWLSAALVANSAAVLIDEPLNALDADSLAYLHRTLLRAAADPARAWIVTSHEALGAAGELAQRVELHAGAAA
ncbi:MAG: ATP-binding cassette domain-containing protein [Burkholderiales bacterium]